MKNTFEPFKREDGKWGWRLIAQNGNIVAGDAGQGYENEQDAIDVGLKVVQGGFPAYPTREGDVIEAVRDYAAAQRATVAQVRGLMPNMAVSIELLRLACSIEVLENVAKDLDTLLRGEQLERKILYTEEVAPDGT